MSAVVEQLHKPAAPLRLNLGCGDSPLEGYENIDLKRGTGAYPLDFPDASVDEVRASHLLEHFGWRGTTKVLAEWVRVLKPGGLLRVAVPDLEKIASMYVNGQAGQYQGWLCGTQDEPMDAHLAQFDWPLLTTLLRQAGLTGIHKWAGEGDTSVLPISLNVGGWKRPEAWPNTIGALSHPRLGFMDNFGCATDALMPLGIAICRRTGAFWGQCLTAAIQAALDNGAQWVLTLDYDSIFAMRDIEDLMTYGMVYQEADALVPVQMNRMKNLVMMRPKGVPAHGQFRMELTEWDVTLWPISMGHFGASLIRASAFAKLAKPWFHSSPDENGEWNGAHVDDDPWFWRRFEEAGCRAFLTPRVVIGHLEQVISWPDRSLNKIYQPTSEWWETGKPGNCWR